jgi:hypothetical protein
MHLRITILLILSLTYCSRLNSKTSDDVLTACAALGPNGISATLTAGANDIRLEITGPPNKSLAVPVRYPWPGPLPKIVQVIRRQSSCTVYFSDDRKYVGFGISSRFGRPEAAHLQIGVADLNTGDWIGNWGVDSQPEFSLPSLAGFLDNATPLVVVGVGERGKVAIQLFSPVGQLQHPAVTVEDQAQITDAFRSFADTLHNRLWSFSCGLIRAKPYYVPLCPVSVTDLVGERRNNFELGFPNYRGKRDDLWQWPGTFAAIDANTILIAETVNGKDTVWSVEMATKAIDRFVLPHHHFVKYNGLVQSTLSPDTEVYAVLLQQVELAFPYLVDNYVFRGTDVIVMQTHPLRLLGQVPHQDSSFTAGLAIDHRDGKAHVLVYRRGHWEHHEFADKVASQPTN